MPGCSFPEGRPPRSLVVAHENPFVPKGMDEKQQVFHLTQDPAVHNQNLPLEAPEPKPPSALCCVSTVGTIGPQPRQSQPTAETCVRPDPMPGSAVDGHLFVPI